MYKFCLILLFTAAVIHYSDAGSLLKSNFNNDLYSTENSATQKDSYSLSVWQTHIMDFLGLIDIESVIPVIFQHINDPEVINFITFLLSPEFKDLVWEFESIQEFREAISFLSDKGYEVEKLIDAVNEALNLPPFEKPVAVANRGLTDLVEALIKALPVEKMRELFEHKMKNDPEFAELINTLTSDEFLDILQRLAGNPKFKDLKEIIEKYGLDFDYVIQLVKEIMGEYSLRIFL